MLDFGLARRRRRMSPTTRGHCHAHDQGTGTVSGTLSYMAPEFLRGESGDAAATSGRSASSSTKLRRASFRFAGTRPSRRALPSCTKCRGRCPRASRPGLWATIQRCLSKDPVAALPARRRSARRRSTRSSRQRLPARSHRASQQASRRWSCAASRHLTSATETCCCWSARRRAHFYCAREPALALGCRGTLLSWARCLLAGVRRAERPSSTLGLDAATSGAPFSAPATISAEAWTNPLEANLKFPPSPGTVAQQYLANRARAHDDDADVLRRRACRPVRVTELRGVVVAGARSVRSSASAALGARAMAGLALHTIVQDPDRFRADVCRDFGGWRLPHR